jgi:hypothetical protein
MRSVTIGAAVVVTLALTGVGSGSTVAPVAIR